MSDRERWIVYPLLFLALGAALRDKLTETVEADFIRCKAILVGENIPEQIRVPYGTVTIYNEAGVPAAQFGRLVQCDEIIVINDKGKPQIVLGVNDAGGLVRVFDRPNKLTLALGHIDRISGLLAGAKGKLIQWVPPFVRPPVPGEESGSTDGLPQEPTTEKPGP